MKRSFLAAISCAAVVACGGKEVSTAVDLPPGPQLVNPGFLAVKLTAPGGSSISQIPIVNNGRQPLVISSVSMSGQDTAHFTLSQPIDTTVNPRSATSIPITFHPTTAGGYVVNVTIESNAENFPEFVVDVVAPSGSGDAPDLQAVDKTVDIGIPSGASEGRGVLRYYNVGKESLIVTGYSFSGGSAASFSLADGTPLPGAACTGNGLECDQGLFCNLLDDTAACTGKLQPNCSSPNCKWSTSGNFCDYTGSCALSVPVADPVVLDIYYNGAGSQNAQFRITAATGSPANVQLNGHH